MSMKNIAVDFGGTMIKLALVENGTILAKNRLDNHSDISDLDRVAKAVSELCSMTAISPRSLGGIGLSLPGIIDFRSGTVASVNGKNAYMTGFDLNGWAQETFSLPMVMENDARLALLGESAHGVAKGARNAVVLILGTGIGTAAIVDGILLRGAHHQAGILGGHVTIDSKGRACNCGNTGCAEAEAGSWNMPAIARDHPRFSRSALAHCPVIDFKAITDAHRAGDTVATDIMNRLIHCWAITTVNLIHSYDPEVVILSGGLLKSGDLVLPPLQDYVYRHIWSPLGRPDIRPAADTDGSVFMGLDYLVTHRKQMGCMQYV